MRKLLFAGVLVAFGLFLACSKGSSTLQVEVGCTEFQQQTTTAKTVTVNHGDEVVVTLCANPTTGFAWETPVIADGSILEQTNHEMLTPTAATTPIAGAATQERWTFNTLKAGTTNVAFTYSQPWNGGQKGAWKFNLTLTAK